MRFLHITYLILVSLLILSSCAYKQNQILFEKRGSIPDSILAKRNLTNIINYRIQPQDILQIRNLQNSKAIVDLTAANANQSNSGAVATPQETFEVEEDGTVALTGLGRVKVEGLTRIEALNKVQQLYKDTFLVAPLIELKIINLKVNVFGEVKTPGAFPLTKDRTTLVDILGAAGGLTEKADERHIQIIRGTGPNPTRINIDWGDIKSITDPRAILQNGDVVYVMQNDRTVRTDALQNFTSIIQPVLIVISAVLLILTITKK
ncbi:MAG: SLBB domain-containing protein [Mucilaginibacter sp.]